MRHRVVTLCALDLFDRPWMIVRPESGAFHMPAYIRCPAADEDGA